jgi:hypothetical protein
MGFSPEILFANNANMTQFTGNFAQIVGNSCRVLHAFGMNCQIMWCSLRYAWARQDQRV